ncbi:hypothetical protein BZG36_03324 [Bifiguratus adelaidae]|uniref:Uncharacterized protein n=1 Tax=Bifiguratus adelaidae TaxID=1938954 RepID=A0A261XXX1_9FUNG|nr:hypothetical protein BZG36_03324 [Bifiguratus adelaidae]
MSEDPWQVRDDSNETETTEPARNVDRGAAVPRWQLRTLREDQDRESHLNKLASRLHKLKKSGTRDTSPSPRHELSEDEMSTHSYDPDESDEGLYLLWDSKRRSRYNTERVLRPLASGLEDASDVSDAPSNDRAHPAITHNAVLSDSSSVASADATTEALRDAIKHKKSASQYTPSYFSTLFSCCCCVDSDD